MKSRYVFVAVALWETRALPAGKRLQIPAR